MVSLTLNNLQLYHIRIFECDLFSIANPRLFDLKYLPILNDLLVIILLILFVFKCKLANLGTFTNQYQTQEPDLRSTLTRN